MHCFISVASWTECWWYQCNLLYKFNLKARQCYFCVAWFCPQGPWASIVRDLLISTKQWMKWIRKLVSSLSANNLLFCPFTGAQHILMSQTLKFKSNAIYLDVECLNKLLTIVNKLNLKTRMENISCQVRPLAGIIDRLKLPDWNIRKKSSESQSHFCQIHR
jgi:hypothetical protein